MWADAAIPALIDALADREWVVGDSSAKSLGQIDRAGATVMPTLIKALQQKKFTGAMEGLGEIGPAAKVAVPALTPL